MNIQDIGTLHKCTSCQMCAAICPKEAISIHLNQDGFYRPLVDTTKCVHCGICKSVCYKYTDISEYKDIDKLINYAASAKNDEIVANTTSGGLGDVFCEQLIKEGFLCVGVTYDTDKNIAVNRIAKTREDSLSFRGSKYIQSYTFEVFKQLVETHLNDKVAVFGTPCHIFAIDQYLRKRNKRDNYILIDIYCHGCPSINIWNKYIQYINNKTQEKTYDYINFRSKTYGWGRYAVQIYKDGKTLFKSPKIKDKFYTLFFSDVLLNEACYDCKLRCTMEFSDIRIGDFWGKTYLKDTRGISLVTVNPESKKGQALFENIKDRITYRQHNTDECISYQSWGKSYIMKANLRQKLFASLANPNHTISDTTSILWKNKSMNEKLKQTAKNIILMMPRPFVTFLKKLV